MAFDFPSSPSAGQIFTPSGGPTYIYHAPVWELFTASAGTAPFDALAYSGMQINGSMEVSQENGIYMVSVSNTTKYFMDGWALIASGPQSHNVAQISSSPPPGFINSAIIALATANAAPAAGDFSLIYHPIEGYRIRRLAWGTANASPITISFWVRAVRPGAYSGAVTNLASTRSYPFTFTISATNTWEYKTVTILGDTAGTWTADNTIGMAVYFAMMVGSTYQAASGAWQAGQFFGATGSINGVAATSDSFFLTGVTVLPGVEAPSAARSPFIMRPYGEELTLCQRYYNVMRALMFGAYGIAGGGLFHSISHPPMRAIPTVAIDYATLGGTNFYNVLTYPPDADQPANSVGFSVNVGADGHATVILDVILDARL